MLSRRLFTTFVFLVPFFVGLLTDAPGHLILAVMGSGCAIWGMSEFFNLAARIGAKPPRFWVYLIAATLPFGVYAHYAVGLEYRWITLWPAVGGIGLLFLVIGSGEIEGTWQTLLVSMVAPLYVQLPLLLVQVFRQAEDGVWFVVFAFLTTWLSDTGAYFGGRKFGRRKMCPAISPGKTWEGFFSGIAFSVFGMLLLGAAQYVFSAEGGARFFWTEGRAADWLRLVLLTLGLIGSGTLGDLAESMLKRSVEVKDSGSSLTGHGGFLDIMDSLLVNLPLLFVWALLFEGLEPG